MTNIEIYSGKKWQVSIDIPTTWDELRPEEVELIGEILSTDGSRQLLFIRLITSRAKTQRVRLPRRWFQALDPEMATIDGLPLVDLLLSDNNRTINPYPVLAGLYGPADNFNDLTVAEFEDAEVLMALYRQKQDDTYLLKLAAGFYRPLAKSSRKRHQYSTYEPDLKSFSKRVPKAKLQAVGLWYVGCRAALVRTFHKVFAPDEQGTTEPNFDAFTRVIHAAAGSKNGTREQIRSTLVKEFLFECQIAAEQFKQE